MKIDEGSQVLERFVEEVKFLFAWQNEDEARDITALVDSDWAGNTGDEDIHKRRSVEDRQTRHPCAVVDATI